MNHEDREGGTGAEEVSPSCCVCQSLGAFGGLHPVSEGGSCAGSWVLVASAAGPARSSPLGLKAGRCHTALARGCLWHGRTCLCARAGEIDGDALL